MADIIQIAEKLNSEVTRLNNERSKLEGMLESAKTNYEKAVKAYEVKYGVKLTEETLQQEYNEVFARTKGAIFDLQEKIESIKRGDYKKDEESVEYDFEPNVEPIRAEVKPEPEKKKRGRKPKAEKVEEVPVSTPIEEIKVEDIAEEIAPSVVETPKADDTPFKLDFDFGGFGDTAPVAPATPKTENKIKGSKGRKPLSPTDISAAVSAGETIKQNPVTFPDMSDDDDEVDLSSMGFGSKPTEGVPPADFSFGGFGDLGNVETPKTEQKAKKDDSGFGGFGDFGSFGDLANSIGDDGSDEIEDVIPGEGFTFGGLGNLGMETPEPKKEKEQAVTPDGWGDMSDFGGFGDFNSILNSGDFKFGE